VSRLIVLEAGLVAPSAVRPTAVTAYCSERVGGKLNSVQSLTRQRHLR
jgi:hypothetical protein